MADAADSKSADRKVVKVRLLSPAPHSKRLIGGLVLPANFAMHIREPRIMLKRIIPHLNPHQRSYASDNRTKRLRE